MPDWSLSPAVLILGLIGLVLGSAGVHRAIGASAHWLDPVGLRRFTPWPALVAMLPAMAVTLQAVGSGASALGLGAIVGIHVLGVLLATGFSSSEPFTKAEGVQRARSRAWSLIGAAVGVWGLALDGGLGRVDGSVLVLLCLLYLAWVTWTAQQSTSPADGNETQALTVDAERMAPPARSRRRLWGLFARVCVWLTLLTMGARVLAMGALDLAPALDLDDWRLGLTFVAPVGVLAGWAPILLFRPRSNGGALLTGRPNLWFDFNLVNLLGLVGLTALTTSGGLPFARETLWASWPLVILTSILAGAALMRAEPA